MYNTGLKPQYLGSYTRPDSTRLEFIFNSPSTVPPRIKVADDEAFPDPLKGELTVGNDTLTFWLPRELASRDTLKLALRYSNVELLTGIETVVNDTVKLLKPKTQAPKKKKDNKKKKERKKSSDDSPLATDSISTLAVDSIDVLAEDSNGVKKHDPKDNDDDKDEDDETPKVPTFTFNAKGPDTDITRPLTIEVPIPLSRIDPYAFRLETKQDTVWIPVKG